MGEVNFYFNYIPNVILVLETFHNLLRKNVNFNSSHDCEKNFNLIKDYFCSERCLAIYNSKKEMMVQTDTRVSLVLVQF